MNISIECPCITKKVLSLLDFCASWYVQIRKNYTELVIKLFKKLFLSTIILIPTSIHEILESCPHDIRVHDCLEKLQFLQLLLLGVVLHHAGAGVVVVKQLGQGGKCWQCLHPGVHVGKQWQV